MIITEQEIVTGFVAVALTTVGCGVAAIISEWIWGPKGPFSRDLLPPPDRLAERKHFNHWEDME